MAGERVVARREVRAMGFARKKNADAGMQAMMVPEARIDHEIRSVVKAPRRIAFSGGCKSDCRPSGTRARNRRNQGGWSSRSVGAPQPRVLPQVAEQVQPGLEDDEQGEGDER